MLVARNITELKYGTASRGGVPFLVLLVAVFFFTVIQLIYIKSFAKYFGLRRRSGTCSVLNSFAAE